MTEKNKELIKQMGRIRKQLLISDEDVADKFFKDYEKWEKKRR